MGTFPLVSILEEVSTLIEELDDVLDRSDWLIVVSADALFVSIVWVLVAPRSIVWELNEKVSVLASEVEDWTELLGIDLEIV